MVVEYVLLLTAFVVLLMKFVFFAPYQAFKEGGPRLGARVEKHLTTGKGFQDMPQRPLNWDVK